MINFRIYNLLSSIPNDDDLKEVYSAERASLMTEHVNKLQQQRQALKLSMVQTCLWLGDVGIEKDASR